MVDSISANTPEADAGEVEEPSPMVVGTVNASVGEGSYEGGSQGVLTSKSFSIARRYLPVELCWLNGADKSSARRWMVNGGLYVSTTGATAQSREVRLTL